MGKEIQKVVLTVLDGWGINQENDGNAIYLANPSNFNRLFEKYPHSLMKAHGSSVGLPENQMGGSEVGHLSIGAGRVIYQELSALNKHIEAGEFQRNENLLNVMRKAKETGHKLHVMGLLSPGGVHSHQNHLYIIMQMAKEMEIDEVYIHAFLDGRDVSPTSARAYIRYLKDKIRITGIGKIASLSGRYYAMDRDERWDRIKLAYDAMAKGEGRKALNAREAVENSYAEGVTDEFLVPTVITDEEGSPISLISDGDSLIYFNFRADRARELTRMFLDSKLDVFPEEKKLKVNMVCMTRYMNDLEMDVAFEVGNVDLTLGELISSKGLKQLRIAETEKFAHVTYFFSGGRETFFEGEERKLIPSPKVATYDKCPEMSAKEIMDATISAIKSGEYHFILVNFANSDMVGHTGKIDAAINAVKCVDECLGEIEKACKDNKTTLIVTADHGNSDEMIDPVTGEINTAHSLAPVPFIIVQDDVSEVEENAELKDIAPTVLDIMGIEKPFQMTGRSVIKSRVEYKTLFD